MSEYVRKKLQDLGTTTTSTQFMPNYCHREATFTIGNTASASTPDIQKKPRPTSPQNVMVCELEDARLSDDDEPKSGILASSIWN